MLGPTDTSFRDIQVEADSSRIQTEEVETKILSEEARRDLAKAMPALEAAIDALEKLDKKSVAEVKAYTKPPGAFMALCTFACTHSGCL